MFGNEAFVPAIIKTPVGSNETRPRRLCRPTKPDCACPLAGAATSPGPAATTATGTARAAPPAAAATGAATAAAAAPPGNLVAQLWLRGVLLVEDVECRQADVGKLFLAEEDLLTRRCIRGR